MLKSLAEADPLVSSRVCNVVLGAVVSEPGSRRRELTVNKGPKGQAQVDWQ